MNLLPKATCNVCRSTARAEVYSTFSYWYCPKCKDETHVRLDFVSTPKGEVYGLYTEDKVIYIDTPGTYVLTYTNSPGVPEWYEHKLGARDIKLDRAAVQSATRIADSDMPSRKRVQQVPSPSEGAETEGLCLRTISNASNSSAGCQELPVANAGSKREPTGEYIYHDSYGNYYRIFPSGGILKLTEEEVRELAPSYFGLQYGKLFSFSADELSHPSAPFFTPQNPIDTNEGSL